MKGEEFMSTNEHIGVRVKICGNHPHAGEYGVIKGIKNTVTGPGFVVKLEDCPHGVDECFVFRPQEMKRAGSFLSLQSKLPTLAIINVKERVRNLSEKSKGGRPDKYKTQIKPKLALIEAWARNGLTDADIAKNLDIAESTLYGYKKKHSEFLEALKRGKDDADLIVENSLYKRANGYSYEEVTYERLPKKVKNGKIIYELVATKKVKKEVPADPASMFFWLKNRKPKIWRDKPDGENPEEVKNIVVTFKKPLEGQE